MSIVDVSTLTPRLQKNALVEVQCGTDHSSIWVPGKGYTCRYARGYVGILDTGLISRSHHCHECSCYWTMKATTPKEEQRCDNCGGPLIVTADSSCWPGVLMVDDFVDPAPWLRYIYAE